MKALSIQQPWASLIAWGEKTIECRSWKTDYRGPILVCVSGRDLKEGQNILPAGFAIAVVDLVGIHPFTRRDLKPAYLQGMKVPEPGSLWAWELANAHEIKPFPVKGKLHLFEVEASPVPLPGASEEYTHIEYIIEYRKREAKESGPSAGSAKRRKNPKAQPKASQGARV